MSTGFRVAGIMPSRTKPVVAVIGSSNTDLVLRCRELPRPGETLLGGDFQQVAGGKGANQAVAACRAGARVLFVGARGEDDFGKQAADGLKKEGIDIRYFLPRKKISSGVALILVGGKNRENMIGVARSANDLLTARDVRSAQKDLSRADVFVAQLETPLPAIMEAARLAFRSGIPFLLNPAPARSLPASLLACVHTLTPNEHEAVLLSGKKTAELAGVALLKKGCHQIVITLGAQGALLIDKEGKRHFPAPKVKPVDTVGAGDCFTGWLALGIAEKLPVAENIRRALRAASLSVTRPGAQSAMPYRKEI
jgi:ribokinase